MAPTWTAVYQQRRRDLAPAQREVRFDFSVFYNDPGIPGRDLDSDTGKKGFKSIGRASAGRPPLWGLVSWRRFGPSFGLRSRNWDARVRRVGTRFLHPSGT